MKNKLLDPKVRAIEFKKFQKYLKEYEELANVTLNFSRGRIEFKIELTTSDSDDGDEYFIDLLDIKFTKAKAKTEEDKLIVAFLNHDWTQDNFREFIYDTDWLEDSPEIKEQRKKLASFFKDINVNSDFSDQDVLKHYFAENYGISDCECCFCYKDEPEDDDFVVKNISLRNSKITINDKKYKLVRV